MFLSVMYFVHIHSGTVYKNDWFKKLTQNMDSMQVTNMFTLEQCLRILIENLGFLLVNF